MSKRNKSNGKHTLESINLKCANGPTVQYKDEYNTKREGVADGAIINNDGIIKVCIRAAGPHLVYHWVSVKNIRGW